MTETTVRGSGECDASSEARLPDALAASLAASGLDPGGGRPHEVVHGTPTGVEYRSLAPPSLGHGRGSIGQVSTGPVPAGPMEVSHPDVLWSPLEVRLGELFAA